MTEIARGRPRSESTRRAILEATSELLVEAGFSRLSIEGIAARAGAGKQTIYRWWGSKSLIVADAVLEGFLQIPPVPLPETDSLKDDLKQWMSGVTASFENPAAISVIHALTTAASDDERESSKLYEQITGPFYVSLTARLARGQDEGQLSSSTSPEAVAEALIGAVLFRSMSRRPAGTSLSAVVDAFVS